MDKAEAINVVERYIYLSNEIKTLQKQVKERRTELQELEPEIREYMELKNTESVVYKNNSIVLVTKNVKKRPNKEEIHDRLNSELGNNKADDIIKIMAEPMDEVSVEKLKIITYRK